MSFPCKPFNITLPDMGNGCSAVSWMLCGASKSGKTTLMKYLLRHYYKKHLTVMFTMNPHAEIYKSLDKKIIVSDEYHSEIISEMHTINKEMKNSHNFLVVSDDYVGLDIKNDKEITRLLTCYRNSSMDSVFSFQGRTLMNAVGRNNCNYIVILKQQTPKDWVCVIEDFLDMWLPMDMTMREKVAFCQAATVKHQFFIIDNMAEECYISKLSPSQVED